MPKSEKTVEETTEQAPVVKPGPVAKHRELTADELKNLKSVAPAGSKELAPGKSFCIGPHVFKSALFSMVKGKDEKETLLRERTKKSCVPEKYLAGINFKPGTFLN